MRALIVLLLVMSAAHATPAPGDAPPSMFEKRKLSDEVCPKVTAPWFFRIEKAGKVSYLLGTRHVGVAFAKFPKVVHDALAHAKRVIFELAPDDHRTRDAAQDKAAEISVPDVLGPDLWQHYRELVGSKSADRHQHTSALSAALAVALVWDDFSSMLEREIEYDATDLKLPMAGLETADFQHDVLVKLYDERMLRAIVSTTKDRAEIRDDKTTGLRRYCEGTEQEPFFDEHTRQVLRDLGYSDGDLDGFEKTLVYDRNASWIPKLEELFASGNVFVAVGAGHLQGPKGVPELLKAKGYKVTRVTPPPLKP